MAREKRDIRALLPVLDQRLHYHQADLDAQGWSGRLTHAFAKEILQVVADRPISFEVFSDDFEEVERQKTNVYVKIPITNTRGASCNELANGWPTGKSS
ncbi:MAG TPA: hypothetical protein VKV28_07035 [Candidatus Binataceae bacterium]|nr:hypothetical protein [Candidatus Binataceae bacterium]